jgi:hypothetical protein
MLLIFEKKLGYASFFSLYFARACCWGKDFALRYNFHSASLHKKFLNAHHLSFTYALRNVQNIKKKCLKDWKI